MVGGRKSPIGFVVAVSIHACDDPRRLKSTTSRHSSVIPIGKVTGAEKFPWASAVVETRNWLLVVMTTEANGEVNPDMVNVLPLIVALVVIVPLCVAAVEAAKTGFCRSRAVLNSMVQNITNFFIRTFCFVQEP